MIRSIAILLQRALNHTWRFQRFSAFRDPYQRVLFSSIMIPVTERHFVPSMICIDIDGQSASIPWARACHLGYLPRHRGRIQPLLSGSIYSLLSNRGPQCQWGCFHLCTFVDTQIHVVILPYDHGGGAIEYCDIVDIVNCISKRPSVISHFRCQWGTWTLKYQAEAVTRSHLILDGSWRMVSFIRKMWLSTHGRSFPEAILI
jgi:hypothetical protein